MIRDSVAAALQSAGCSLTHAAIGARGVVVSGLVSRAAEADLRRRITDAVPPNAPANPVDVRVETFDGPYCDVLDTLRPIASQPLPLALRGGTHLRKDDDIVPQVTMPAIPSWLLVDYFSSDGGLAHLHPSPQTPARQEMAGSVVTLGSTPAEGWKVDAPFGTDMVVAIVSSTPLFPEIRPADETVQAYLAALHSAFDSITRAGGHVTATAVAVQTSPR